MNVQLSSIRQVCTSFKPRNVPLNRNFDLRACSLLSLEQSLVLTYKRYNGAHTHQAQPEVEQNVAATGAQVILLGNWWLQNRN